MTRRERLMATLQGAHVDRPAVNLYEINGFDQTADGDDPFNIYSHPSWKPLLRLARERSDVILMRGVLLPDGMAEDYSYYDFFGGLAEIQREHCDDRLIIEAHSMRLPDRELRAVSHRYRDADTVWTVRHLLQSADDLTAWLKMPVPSLEDYAESCLQTAVAAVTKAEREIGDAGIVMLDLPDPLCLAAGLFDMKLFLLLAAQEGKLFHQTLERYAGVLYEMVEKICRVLPGRLWRIFGPEYSSPPYLPARLFKEYVVDYDRPLINLIQKSGGYARIHSHGRLQDILSLIADMNADALDPIEPPPLGDVELAAVRARYGKKMVLFGNLEVRDIVNLETAAFEKKVEQALRDGTKGQGRGFVLMPSASPVGRVLTPRTSNNYETMVRIAESFSE